MYDHAETVRLLGLEPWAQRLGIRVAHVADGSLALELAIGDDHLNFLDGAHGGVLFSLAETAARLAAAQRGTDPILIDGHLVLTAGGQGGNLFTATVSEVKRGQSLGVFRVAVTRDDGRLVGEFTATIGGER